MSQRGLRSRIVGYVEEIAASLRRRKVKQEPRVRIGWEDGEPQLVAWNSEVGEEMLSTGEELIEALCPEITEDAEGGLPQDADGGSTQDHSGQSEKGH